MGTRGQPTSLTLYDHPYSPASARVRIACKIKAIPLTLERIALGRGANAAQNAPEFLAINPNGLVPVLVAQYADGSKLTLSQSVAILEFLEETYAADAPWRPALLPSVKDMNERCKVRELVMLLCADLHPPTNLRVRELVKGLGGDVNVYVKAIFTRVFDAFEVAVKDSKGTYCVGKEVTLADICLVTMAWEWEKREDLESWPNILEIVTNCRKKEAFQL